MELDNVFWLAVAIIFLATLVGGVVRRLKKDRCLKLFHEYHVTLLTEGGNVSWGDLDVASQGLELQFDSPYVNRRNLTKNGFLMYETEFPQLLALCRVGSALTPQEKVSTREQLSRFVDPPPLRRLTRQLANLVNMVRDAILATLGMFLGRMGGRGRMGTVAKDQSGRITEMSGNLLGTVSQAYEPLLERHLGKPVILRLTLPGKSAPQTIELPGYLAEYSEKFIAIMNPDHEPAERWDLKVTKSKTLDGASLELSAEELVVRCTGPDPVVIDQIVAGESQADLGVALLPGESLRFRRVNSEPPQIKLERTQRLDLVCPRTRARVSFVSSAPPVRRSRWQGSAPEVDPSPDDHGPSKASSPRRRKPAK